MNRHQRIEKAQAKLRELEPQWKRLKKQYEDAQSELHRAEASYDVGERVRVTETCRRGCCVENEYTGTVKGTQPNGSYIIQGDDGHKYEWASSYDMKRL